MAIDGLWRTIGGGIEAWSGGSVAADHSAACDERREGEKSGAGEKES